MRSLCEGIEEMKKYFLISIFLLSVVAAKTMNAESLPVVAATETVAVKPKSGIILEPVLGYLMNDIVDENKSVAGLRASFFLHDMSDATFAGEVEGLAATRWTGSGKTPNTDYFFQFGPAAYEFYEPWAFRVGAGMSNEFRDGAASLGVYYRGALGYYFTRHVGAFADASGLILFRSAKTSLPMELAATLQIVF